MIAKIVLINCFLWKGIIAPAPVFNLQNCDGGCKSQNDCPTNSACIPVIGQTCGLCLCTVGFVLQNGVCVATAAPPIQETFGQQVPPKAQSGGVDSGNRPNGGGGGVAPVAVPPPQAAPSPPVAPVATVAVVQPPPQPPVAGVGGGNVANGEIPPDQGSGFDCNRYKCDGLGASKDCAADSAPSSIQCPNLAGGGQCMLGSCLRVNATLSYCLCPYGRQSRTCHLKKTGNCNGADGKLAPDASETKGKRFRHIRDPDNGAVLARHAVDSLSDCIRLCQWATYQQCRSINFGAINGQKTCELLTVWANKESILYQWLKDDPDWTYVCCFK